jgi:hypothetical protein
VRSANHTYEKIVPHCRILSQKIYTTDQEDRYVQDEVIAFHRVYAFKAKHHNPVQEIIEDNKNDRDDETTLS